MPKINSFDAFRRAGKATLFAFLIGMFGTCAITAEILSLVNVPVLHADAQRAEATVTKLEHVLLDLGPDPGHRPRPGPPKRVMMMCQWSAFRTGQGKSRSVSRM